MTRRRSGRARLPAAGLALVAAVIGLWAVRWAVTGSFDSDDAERRPLSEPAALETPPAEVPDAPERASNLDSSVLEQARGPLPHSLRGTEIDGGLTVDADGAFLPTPDAIALFDYFLAASGEESPAVIRQRIIDQIRGRLTGAAASDAEALLDTYLAFREEMRELVQAAEAPRDLERRLQWIRELRREHFGPEVAEALFREAEDIVSIDLERRRVAMDPSLGPEERAARLAALDERLPESVREVRRSSRAPQRVHEEVAALRSAGASDAEVFALREQTFGTEAAERLAALDAQRAEWQQRLEAYQAERDELLAGEGLAAAPAEEREAALDALRRSRFEASELQRVRAVDRFGR